jgi:glycosyltransferase involved in cell wall biosynthesis
VSLDEDSDRWTPGEVWSLSEALGLGRDSDLAALRDSGLIDPEYYAATGPVPGDDPAAHFLDHGWREGRQPNPYFAPHWYLRQNPDVQRAGVNPLLHYLRYGEAERRAPCAWFDLAWYASRHTAPAGRSLLWHLLQQRRSGAVSPLPEFDPEFYLTTYPDIAAAGIDPFEHYLHWGYREGRDPSAEFDTKYYLRRYLDGDLAENPLLHYRRARHLIRLHPRPPPDESDAFEQARYTTRPGPLFEARAPLPPSARRRAKLLAYYLPQFHPIAENDAWWGEGFTEWTSIARAMPRFAGHYQPRIPRDLGHYSLADPETMRRQIDMAREAGLFGFVHYFYWFNGRRLLERPTEAMLADPSLDFPFCLMWANENWSRRWDGSEQEVLIAQDWRREDEPALLDCLARHFRDPRYIRIAGRPVLMLYRPGLIPDTAVTIARWRRRFQRRHGENPLLVMSQSFAASDPAAFGCDGAIEFPPHKLVDGLALQNQHLRYFDPRATAQVYAFADIAAASLAEPSPAFPLIKTAIPGWDNDARRQGAGMVVHGATPAAYQAWLAALVDRAVAQPFLGEPLVCINAWNEWAEGAYLEPDCHFGAAFLNATARAVTGLGAEAAGPGLLLVGHDAFPAGAQLLLLHLARRLRAAFGARLEVLLLGDGTLRADYAAVAPTRLASTPEALREAVAAAAGRGFRAALVNSSAAAWSIPALHEAGIASTLLVHELPRLIAEKQLHPGPGATLARHVVFPAAAVRDGFAAICALPADRVLLAPQGIYRPIAFSARRRAAHRARLGVAERAGLVLGAGYGDLRKGFDLFLQAWRAASRRDRQVVFCWIGALDPAMQGYLAPEIEAAIATGRFLLPGHQDDVADWFCAADLFALTSREDPFPSTVLEALSAGLPVVAFEGAGGIPALLRGHACGRAVPMADATAMARALLAQFHHGATDRARLAGLARRHFDFAAYAEAMLHLAQPELPRISVVVPGYNYARYLTGRLASIFAQTHPVAEILVLDDASADHSPAVASRVAAAAGREIRQLVNIENSGGVFQQWRHGVEQARGDWVWIAEADDLAEPALLATLAARLATAPDVVMALCDSRSIDADGAGIWPDYQGYYASSGAGALAQDGLFPARDFAARFLAERNLILNASAVLWRRTALLEALRRCTTELQAYRMAGDWRLYLEVLGHSDGQVAWVAQPLNIHRRHAASVTGSLAPDAQVAEIARAQGAALEILGGGAELVKRQEEYRKEVAE